LERDDAKPSSTWVIQGNTQPHETKLVDEGTKDKEKRQRSGSKGASIGCQGQNDPLGTAVEEERDLLSGSDFPRETKAEPNSIAAKIASCESNPRNPPDGEAMGKAAEDVVIGQPPAGHAGHAAPRAAWGASLVCADLTLHDVASTWWPGMPQPLGELTAKALKEASVEGGSAGPILPLQDLTRALEESITKAYMDSVQTKEGKSLRLTTGMKSLVAATAFDELIRDQQMQPLDDDVATTETERHDSRKDGGNVENE
jgi:hypothetical protein